MRHRACGFLLTLLIFGGLLLGWMPEAIAYSSYNEEQKLLLQAWRLVNQSYIDDSFNHQNWWFVRQQYLKQPLKNREATYAAIDGMLASLDEPFTRLLRPQEYRSFQVSTKGELSGIGLQINLNPTTGFLEVISPLPGSPAEQAHLVPGDRILAIDGQDTQSLSLEEAAIKMRGPKGTQVSLTVQPPNSSQTAVRTVKLTRARIELSPVVTNLDQSVTPPIGYLRLTQFSANASADVAQAIKNLDQQGAVAFMLDLRNNPGGLLGAGIEIARLWLDQATIVYTANRQGIAESFTSTDSPLTTKPLVVLVNQGTASASEILAGALQENDRAQLVGTTTFGKGLIQSLFELPDGAGLTVTVAKYETPQHHDIHKRGIRPDSVIEQGPITLDQIGTDVDQQYQKALELLTSGSILAQTASSNG